MDNVNLSVLPLISQLAGEGRQCSVEFDADLVAVSPLFFLFFVFFF